MDLRLLWIALAALIGALLHLIQGGVSWKQGIITGVITAIVFAVGYQLQAAGLTVLDLFLSVIGGYGVNAGVSSISQQKQLKLFKKTYPDYKSKMKQPK